MVLRVQSTVWQNWFRLWLGAAPSHYLLMALSDIDVCVSSDQWVIYVSLRKYNGYYFIPSLKRFKSALGPIVSFLRSRFAKWHNASQDAIQLNRLDILDLSTHLSLDKMATIIFADDIFKCIFMNEWFCISIRISLFAPKGTIDNKSALVQIMACHQTGDKPLPELMLTQFTDAYIGH